jgi:cysteinyl-tRNA synthetase
MKKINIKDTLTETKKNINNEQKKTVKIYICGITPYDNPHIGHARCYVIYDVLIRTLKYFSISYTYCRNVTDIDDKLINKARDIYNDGNKFNKIASNYYKVFIENLNSLGCIKPCVEPRVTENIEDIIKFIEALIRGGNAYQVKNDVYFNVNSFKNYGKLSKRPIDEQISNVRIKENDEKKHTLDFALWKGANEDPNWNSPWGKGRPGWHIECSVMAKKHLGETIDIHGGGMDLIFPHHENEKAQTEALTKKEFVKTWMHVAFVCVNKDKMSKSLNNFVTINEVLEKIDPMVFRYYLLNNHYQTPFNFSWDDLFASQKAYLKLIDLFDNVNTKLSTNEKLQVIDDLEAVISDDLNTAKCIGYIFKNYDLIDGCNSTKAAVYKFINEVLGLFLVPIKTKNENAEYNAKIISLINDREKARIAKDFERADEIRDKLKKLGIKIEDKKL